MDNFSPSERIILKKLYQDFNIVSAKLFSIAKLIIKQKISSYPIFVACNTPILLGIKIEDLPMTYFEFRASHLENFVKQKFITKNTTPQFQSNYPDPHQKACLFMVTEEFQKFIFVPYPNKPEN
jgi:hypothetical protein